MKRATAPGKLLLSGAYAVLEGAPAIVCAVDRRASAWGRIAQDERAPAEVRAALSDPPHVDTSALEAGGRKLGLGSSAAGLVAALALRAAEAGEDVRAASVRDGIFSRARAAHAEVQRGGSGVDVAASVHGGVLRYRAAGAGRCERAELPPDMKLVAFFSGQSARTSDLRARVDALRARDLAGHRRLMDALAAVAERAEAAVLARSAPELVAALQQTARGLAALGAAADAPIVPAAFAELAALAEREGAAFFPSGAGGGDVGAFVGAQGPSTSFVRKADQLEMKRLDLAIDYEGVIVLDAT